MGNENEKISVIKNSKTKNLWFYTVYKYDGFFEKWRVDEGGVEFRGSKSELTKHLNKKYPKNTSIYFLKDFRDTPYWVN